MIEKIRRSFRPAILALVLVLTASCSQGGAVDPVDSPTPSASNSNGGGAGSEGRLSLDRIKVQTTVATVYYTVHGSTTSQIFQSIEEVGPSNDGETASGLTETVWAYRLETLPSAVGCSIGPMEISVDITVTLPAHEDLAGLKTELADRWQEFADGVEDHEQRHVEINLAGAEMIRTKMLEIPPSPDCKSLEAEVETLWNSQQLLVQAEHDAFHLVEEARVGLLRAPIIADIEANRDRINLLAAEIEALDAQIDIQSTDVDRAELQLEVLRDEIDRILADFPDGNLPEGVFAQYDELRLHFNSLASGFNELVDVYNESIAERARTADEHDALVTATNRLVEDFNWAR